MYNMAKLFESAKENLGFLLVCVLVFAGLFLLAKLYEFFAMRRQRRVSQAHYAAYVAVFGALAGALMLLEIPLFFAPGFYKLDASEIPVMICTFYLGPVAGVATELVKVIVKLLLKGTTTAFVGDFANFVVGCTFVLPASMLYHMRKTKRMALYSCLLGTVCMAAFGSFFNAVYLLPKFSQLFGLPLEAIIGMGTAVNGAITSVSTLVLFAVVPFNILKGAMITLLTFLLYKRVEKLIFRRAERVAEISKQSET